MKLSKLLSGIYDIKDIPDTEITDLCCDSRRVTPGCAFVCLSGSAADGHRFALSAQQNGAAVIVAEHKTDSTLPHIIVPDTRKAVFELSAQWFDHPEKKLRFIGVTGTNGKTSTVYYIKQILDSMGKKTGLIGTVSNMIGETELPSGATTPEPYKLCSLLCQMVQAQVEYVVMEVSSHSLDQKRVCGIDFDAAVFTNLSEDHLDYHGDMEHYFGAKRRLFLQTKRAVLNIDDEAGNMLSEQLECPKTTYSRRYNHADIVAKDIKPKAQGVRFLAVTRGGIARVKVASPGIFTVYNALAAIGAVYALGFTLDDMAPALSQLYPVSGRAQVISGDRDYTVMIDYAHTPDGLENILSSVREYAAGRIITVFGCGGDRDRLKRPIMGGIAARLSDYVVVTSDNPRGEKPSSIIEDILEGMKKSRTPRAVIENRREAIEHAIDMARPGDIVVLAGKGHEKYQIIGDRRVEFDEREIALNIMERLGK